MVSLQARFKDGRRRPRPGGLRARATAATQRLQSLDAFRGLIMLMMGSAGFAFGEVARRVPGRIWGILAL